MEGRGTIDKKTLRKMVEMNFTVIGCENVELRLVLTPQQEPRSMRREDTIKALYALLYGQSRPITRTRKGEGK